jgi:hypothetical protein
MGRHLASAAAMARLELRDTPDKLSHRDMLVLSFMAMTALDPGPDVDEPGLYFAGWLPLAHQLGFPDTTPAAVESVRASVHKLRKTKLVELADPATQRRHGPNRVYRLLV